MDSTTYQELFSDGIGEIGFGGGALRIDFFSMEPAGEGSQPGRKPCVRIVMTPQGFINAYAAMQGMIEKMREMGILQEAAKGEPTGPAAVVSPNF